MQKSSLEKPESDDAKEEDADQQPSTPPRTDLPAETAKRKQTPLQRRGLDYAD